MRLKAITLLVPLVLLLSVRSARDQASSPAPSNPFLGVMVNPVDYGAKCNSMTDDTIALTNAIGALPAADGGTLLLPTSCGKLRFTATINVGKSLRIISFGSPTNLNAAAPGLNYIGNGAAFSISSATDFVMDSVATLGGNPFVTIRDGSGVGRLYGFYRNTFSGISAIVTGASNPFVRIRENNFLTKSFAIRVGQNTDAEIFSNYFQAAGPSVLYHINLLSGSANVRLEWNTFVGTNAATPDVQVNVGGSGGVNVQGLFIHRNKFGNEVVRGGDSRVKFVYDGVGGANVLDSSISFNYVANGTGGTGIQSFINFRDAIAPAAIAFVRVAIMGNQVASGPGTGWFINDGTNASSQANIVWGNSASSGSFAALIRNGTGFPLVAATQRAGTTAGTALAGHISTATPLALGTIPGNSCRPTTITVPGAATGDSVYVSPGGNPGAGLGWSAYVSTANTVTVVVCNHTVTSAATTNQTWRADVWKH